MSNQAILDLGRADTVTRRGNDIVVAPDELEVAVRIGDALIAGRHPVADEFFTRGVGLAPILQEHHRVGPLDCDLPELTGRALRTIGADYRDRVPGHRLPHGAEPRNVDRRA